jgi:hypothetical protein
MRAEVGRLFSREEIFDEFMEFLGDAKRAGRTRI